jgi:ribosomal protein L5
MTKIAGQKPVVTKARKSIANFKIRRVIRSAARSRCAVRDV